MTQSKRLKCNETKFQNIFVLVGDKHVAAGSYLAPTDELPVNRANPVT